MAFVNKINGGNNIVTPVGDVVFCSVNTAYDTFKGKHSYTVSLAFDETTDGAFTKTIEDLYRAVQALPENEGKKWMPEARLGHYEDNKGKKLWKFKTKAFEDAMDDKSPKKTVFVANIFQKPLPDTTIGRGSKVQVQFSATWSYESKMNNGLSLWLEGIMVHDLVEVGSSKINFEFKVPDTSFVPTVNTDEIAF